jgi:hypothetical protein
MVSEDNGFGVTVVLKNYGKGFTGSLTHGAHRS